MATKSFEIQEEKEATYHKLVSPKLMEELKEKILQRLVIQKKYRDGNYTARMMADELQTNVRYVSAVIRVQFHTNYTTLVNRFRVEEAMSLLTDHRYEELSVEEIGDIVGFAHRQSFHAAFQKYAGTTPKAFRTQYEQRLPPKPNKKDKNNKKKKS